ncbi:hypothetical protein Ae201684P_019429 [Aphanomyces euteiches]|nr:hypothetical protein Ae201684P_019429 [Aphanomyces euteiches]
MPGYQHLTPLYDKRVPNRYLVVRTLWASTPVFFHNTSTTMTRASTSSAAIFNLTLNSALDATSPSANYNNGKAECLAWLAALRVTDAYRLKYPSTRVFSGPGRRNRLDYIFVDWGLATHHLHNSIAATI